MHSPHSAIAKKIDFIGHTQSINGDEIMALNEVELQKVVMSTNIYYTHVPRCKTSCD
jgi:hypothetical protein